MRMQRAAHNTARAAARSALPRRAASSSAYACVIPTYHFQDSLPRLGIPKLEDTLSKYLYFTEPVLTPDEHAATRKAVEEFGRPDGAGVKLHKHLLEWDAAHKGTSYISEMWYDMYLQNRDPLPLNLNPQLTWRDDAVPSKNEQATKAANLVAAAVRFSQALANETLEPDVFHMKPERSKAPWFQRVASMVPRKFSWYAMYAMDAYPLDMSQYPRLFRSTRVPKEGMDELTSATGSTHIVVLRGPRAYTVEVLTPTGPVPVEHIEAQLRGILADSAATPSSTGTIVAASGGPTGAAKDAYAREAPVAALTGIERTAWAKARAAMERSPANAASLKAIDGALFVLTLDDDTPTTHEELSRSMLHGDGRNRWFDKCFNLIVTANGKAGINWEHAWGDGAAVLYFFNNVYRDITEMPAREKAAARMDLTQRLNWDLSDSGVVSAIRSAEKYSDGVLADTELKVYQSASMTKEDVKRSNLSPDGVMQMILQLAHVRAHGYTPATYESASTAGFKHGRTETIRSATPESVSMCKTFLDAKTGGSSEGQVARYEALSKATAKHRKITVDCLMGKGVDRHLFALNKWAERLNYAPIPSIFTENGYKKFKDIRLSTSTLASPALEGGGFGPVSRTSYGVGYGIEERGAHFHVMNYKKQDTNGPAFIAGLESALKDFHACIDAAKAANKITKDSK